MTTHTFTNIIHREDNLYVAECPEVGMVSQGAALDEALENLKEATDLYLEEFPIVWGCCLAFSGLLSFFC